MQRDPSWSLELYRLGTTVPWPVATGPWPGVLRSIVLWWPQSRIISVLTRAWRREGGRIFWISPCSRQMGNGWLLLNNCIRNVGPLCLVQCDQNSFCMALFLLHGSWILPQTSHNLFVPLISVFFWTLLLYPLIHRNFSRRVSCTLRTYFFL